MSVKELIQRYKTDEKFRNKVSLYGGAATSLAFVAIQLYGGIRYRSVWFTAFAVYYAVLTVVKFYIGRSVGKRGKAGWVVFRTVGAVMTILNLALVVMIAMMIANPSIAIHKYSFAIAVVVAVWTLGSAGVTIYEVVKVRKKNDPVALADRLVQLITSIVSVLMLQTAMIASISSLEIETVVESIENVSSIANAPPEMAELLSETFQKLATSNTATGIVVGIFANGVTAYMIVRGTVEKKKLDKRK